MRITATQYAKSLYELTKDKSHKEINGIVDNFFKVLVRNRQQKLFGKIIERFAEIYNHEKGIVEAEVITRSKLENTKEVEKFIEEKYKAKEVVLNNKVDEKIKGGIIIKVGDEVLDGSIAKQLSNLKNNLSK